MVENKDLKFLNDPTEIEYAKKMVNDWIDEQITKPILINAPN